MSANMAKITMTPKMTTTLNHLLRPGVTGLVLAGVACVWAAPPLYVCPGPLFTNDLDPAQARARACVQAQAGRLSQAHNADADSSAPVQGTAPTAGPLAPAQSAQAQKAPTAPTAATPATSTATPSPISLSDGLKQRQRDSQAREIILAELARTQTQLQALSAKPHNSPETDRALQRLRVDEEALRRELARRPS
jgi:hypothetical protein